MQLQSKFGMDSQDSEKNSLCVSGSGPAIARLRKICARLRQIMCNIAEDIFKITRDLCKITQDYGHDIYVSLLCSLICTSAKLENLQHCLRIINTTRLIILIIMRHVEAGHCDPFN